MTTRLEEMRRLYSNPLFLATVPEPLPTDLHDLLALAGMVAIVRDGNRDRIDARLRRAALAALFAALAKLEAPQC